MKHLEIERKYLVRMEMWDQVEKPEGRELIQGYLCRDDQKVIRVRIVRIKAGKKGYLTIKGKIENLGRPEFEYEIPAEEALDLLALALFHPIEKTRYKYLYRGKIWDVDIFHGVNKGLYMAELELDDPDEVIDFPTWVGEEVSHDLRYYNSYLSEHPYKTWQQKKE
ncbi:MAG: CYTH domain-containing protein [Bacteroidota bacterium]